MQCVSGLGKAENKREHSGTGILGRRFSAGSLPGLQLQQHLERKAAQPQTAGEEDGQHLRGACKYCRDKVKVAGVSLWDKRGPEKIFAT